MLPSSSFSPKFVIGLTFQKEKENPPFSPLIIIILSPPPPLSSLLSPNSKSCRRQRLERRRGRKVGRKTRADFLKRRGAFATQKQRSRRDTKKKRREKGKKKIGFQPCHRDQKWKISSEGKARKFLYDLTSFFLVGCPGVGMGGGGYWTVRAVRFGKGEEEMVGQIVNNPLLTPSLPPPPGQKRSRKCRIHRD